MAKSCVTVYLDENGKKSLHYYNNLHLGEESARNIYLEKMAVHAFTKFQKGEKGLEVITDYLERSETFSKPDDNETEFYIDVDGKEHDRTTHFNSKLQNVFKMKEAAAELARMNRARNILIEQGIEKYGLSKKEVKLFKEKGISSKVMEKEYSEAIADADSWIEQNDARHQEAIAEVVKLWDFKTEAGTEIHNVIEKYVDAREDPASRDDDGDLDMDKILSVALQGNTNKTEYKRLLVQIEDFLKNAGKGKTLKFKTEVIIFDSELGIAGSIDLLGYDEKTGETYIFDYKTKETGKEWLFDAQFQKMKDPAQELYDNKQTHAELQTSMYQLMLERAGINVVESRVVYIEADVKDRAGDLKYEKFKVKKQILLNYHKGPLARLIKTEKDIDINENAGTFATDVNFLLGEVSGHDNFDDYKDIEKVIKKKLNSVWTDKETGKQYFFNRVTGKKEFYKSTENKARKEQLRKYYKEEKKVAGELSNNLIKFFNDGKQTWPKGQGDSKVTMTQQALNLLGGISPETHTLKKVNTIYGFDDGTLSDDVLIAIDRVSKEGRIINVNGRSPVSMKIEGKIRPSDKNMFSAKITDRSMQVNHGIKGLEATDENFKLLRGSMIAMELQRTGVISSIKSIGNGDITGFAGHGHKLSKPVNIGMNTMLKHVQVLNDVTKDTQKKGVKKVLGNRKLMRPSTYKTDHVANLYDKIMAEHFDAGLLHNKSATDALEQHARGEMKDAALIQNLIKIQQKVARSLRTNKREDLANSEEYRLLSRAILQLARVNLEVGEYSRKLSIDARVRTISRIGNEAIQLLDAKVKATEASINHEFKKFDLEHTKVMNELMADKKKSKVGFSDGSELFENLFSTKDFYKMSEQERKQNVDDLFRLHDPEDRTVDLSVAERNYIRFFNKWIKAGFKIGLPTQHFEKIADGTIWDEGRVPLVRAGLANKRSRQEGLLNKIKFTTKDGLFKNNKNTQDTITEINTRVENRFVKQAQGGIQGGEERLKMLGLDSEGDQAGTARELETSLEAVLNAFMEENLRGSMYEETLGVYNAMNLVAAIEEEEFFNETTEMRKFMDDYVKLIVFGEHKDQGKFGKNVDAANKALTGFALGFSAKQVVLEAATNLFGSTSSAISQQFVGLIGGEKRFGMGDWTSAGAAIVGQRGSTINSDQITKAEAVAREFGLYKSDSEAISSAEHMESRKNGVFQSKWMYHLNNMPFRFFKAQTFIAEMMHDGVWDAMEVGENGLLKYNPAKDKRFQGVFSNPEDPSWKEYSLESLTIPNKVDGKINEDHAYYKRLRFEALVEQANLEGSIGDDNMPTLPYTWKETAAKKDYAMSLYGSMDKDAKVLAQASSVGRMFLKFKNWLVSKKDNYWTPTHMSEIRGETKWVVDEEHQDGGYYEWESETVEGTMQTLAHMMNAVRENGIGSFKEDFGKMSRTQKENVAKLGADLLLFGILTALFSMLFDMDAFKSGPGKNLVAKPLTNAITDLSVFNLYSATVDSNPVAVASYAQRLTGSLFNSIYYTSTGEFGEGADALFKNFGAYRSFN
jgi:hypothetical protein